MDNSLDLVSPEVQSYLEIGVQERDGRTSVVVLN